ncbi:MAG: aldo/keto reductase [Proteobacteria bacterium]|nr:aldo/keto reductase [Pseudomonadota bacterium]
MQYRRLGRTNLEISLLGFGAGAVGGLMTRGAVADQERALARAVELGINYIDTAPLYGNGESERSLGRALKTLKPDVVIGTKVRLKAADRSRIGDFVAQSMDESLRRLDRDHVDLFQLHNPLVARDADDHLAIDMALAEVVPAMQRLQKAGKTRFIGLSGVGETPALLQAIEAGVFDTMQVVYNVLNSSAGGSMPNGAPGQDYGRLLERTRAMDMGTIVIRALAGGALAGTTERHPLAMQVVDPIGSAPSFVEDVARAKALEPLVKQGVASSLTELALRFVIAHPAVTTMLVGYSTLDQLEQAAAAVNKGPLSEEALLRLRT